MALTERSEKILQAVIDSYILSGTPVGSNVLCQRYNFGLSSATLRNIMAELEEMGFLTHPHTSAGRIPTDKGYRYYIDMLVSLEDGAEEMEGRLSAVPGLGGGDLHTLMADACQFLAALSRNAGVVVAPAEPEGSYRHIEFVRLRGRQVLIIFVTAGGLVQNKLIDLDESIDQRALNAFSRFLDEELERYSLAEIRARLQQQLGEQKLVFMQLMDETYQASYDIRDRDTEKIFVGGAAQVLDHPEFANVEKMKALLRAFEDKYKLLKLLDMSIAAEGIKVFIGSENPYFEMQGCSIVVSKYRAAGNVVGTLGVIGPTRMQYRQAIQVVDYTSRLLSRILSERLHRGIEGK